ncbi:MAG: hypothetical protein K1X35_06440 [Caulobacteraceae bacterium]|nr:hypothetical protein [Caulobacteraceae bacterium]
MAGNLEAVIAGRPDLLVIGLVGNAHARRIDRTSGGRRRASAAALLGRERTVSLDVDTVGGSAWFCSDDGCGPHAAPVHAATPRRGFRPADSDPEVDFFYSPGARLTPSEPIGFVAAAGIS